MMKALDELMYVASAEWLLRRRPNGGTVILLRSLWVAGLLFAAYVWFKQILDPSRLWWTFDGKELLKQVHESLEAFGAIFAVVYATLYTRFASQWSYLAGLYNEIVKISIETEEDAGSRTGLMSWWKAAFIEDAIDLHLSTKHLFIPAIKDWLKEQDVRTAFLEGAFGGEQRLARLEMALDEVSSRIQARNRI